MNYLKLIIKTHNKYFYSIYLSKKKSYIFANKFANEMINHNRDIKVYIKLNKGISSYSRMC